MLKSKCRIFLSGILLLIAVITGCSALRNDGAHDTSSCAASDCHFSTILKATYDPASGKHQAHVERQKIDCYVCHDDYDFNSMHKNGMVNNSDGGYNIIEFNDSQPNANFDTNTKTCSNITCHGSVGWNAPGGSTCTTICHQPGNVFPLPPDPNTGSHIPHLAKSNINCGSCHFNYSDSSGHQDGISNPSLSIAFDSAVNPNGSYSSGKCSNIICHGNFAGGNNASPQWGGKADCATSQCHGGNSTGNPASSGNPDPTHGTHVTMLTNAINPLTGLPYTESESCGVCHSGGGFGTATHGNLTIDIGFNYPLGSGNVTGGTLDPQTGQFTPIVCANTYCHGNFTGGNAATVSWNDTVACGSCHTTSPVTVKHSKHLAQYSGQCGYCHQNYTASATPANHVNFKKDVVFGYAHPGSTDPLSPTYVSSTKTCEGVYCHGNFPQVTYNSKLKNPGNGANPRWADSSKAECGTSGACHGNATNNYSSDTHGKHTSDTAYFGKTDSIESCDACHSDGVDTIRTFNSDVTNGPISTQGTYGSSKHADFSITSSGVNADVNFKTDNSDLASRTSSYTQVSAHTTWNYPINSTTTCSNSWCHGNFDNGAGLAGNNSTNNPDWLNPKTPATTCGTCHNEAEPLTGSHIKHRSAPYVYDCVRCHSAGFSGHVNGTFGGGNNDVVFDSTNPNGSYNTSTKQCSNLYCHGNTTNTGKGNDWGNFTYGSTSAKDNDPLWGATGTVKCANETCHYATSSTLTTGRHQKHIGNSGSNYNYTCSQCHSDSVNPDNTFKDGHANGSLSVSAYNPDHTCSSSLYCHGNFTGGNQTNVADWTKSGSGSGGYCGECHDLAPANATYGVHDKHTDSSKHNYNCSFCHSGIATGTEGSVSFDTTDISGVPSYKYYHVVDFAPTVRFSGLADKAPDTKPNTTASYNLGTKACSNTYCHGDFDEGKNASPTWTTGSTAACGTCHDTAPANGTGLGQYGVHDKHTNTNTDVTKNGYNYACQLCHYGTVADATVKEGIAFDSATHLNTTARWTSHVDGNVNVNFTGLADQGPGTNTAGYNWDGSNELTKTCSDTYCHGDFAGSTVNLPNSNWNEGNIANTPPSWATGSTADCGTCHGTTTGSNAGLGIPNANNVWSTNESHVKHAGDFAANGYKYPCGFCHNGVYDATLSTGNGTGGAYESGTKTPNYAIHADGNRTALSFYASFNSSGTAVVNGLQDVTCSSLYCHSDGWDTARTVADTGGNSTPRWGGASKSTIVCDSCHRNAAGSPAPNETTGRDHYNPNGDNAHATTCNHCHKYVTSSSGETPSNSSDTILFSNNRHVNRMKNVSFGLHTAANGSNYYYTRTNGACYVNCHTAVGIFEPHPPRTGWYGSTFSGSMTYEP